jgi:outer membrane receptor protein involved in Fe transport
MRTPHRFLWIVSLAVLLAVPAVLAQTTGDIQGTVSDSDGKPLPGVTVEATSPNLQGTRVVVTGTNGNYRIPAVPPGTYKVKGSLSGAGSVEKTAVVTLDATATVNMTLRLAATEAVVVSGEAPLVDVTSTTTGSSYSAKVIEKLPTARNYADIVRSNPGVNVDRGETQGRALALTVYGATSVENQYIIDGVNTTNVIKGFQGKAINTEFIQEVEVKTGGYQAEYGRALGGVVNVITKSGGNEFHGDGFVYYDRQSMKANQKITPNDSLTGMRISDYKRTDFGADIGGYAWKDRIWFFMAYDRVNNPNQVSRYVSSSVVPSTAQFPLDETDNLYSGKLTFNILQGTTLVATGFSDPTVISGAANADPRQARVTQISSFDPRTWESRRDIGGTDLGLRLNQLFGSVGLATLQVSQHKDRFQLTPSGAGSGIRQDDLTCSGGTTANPCSPPATPTTTGGFGEIFGPTQNNKSSRNQYRGDFTFYAGPHEAKFGGDYQAGKTTAITFYTGGQLVQKFNEYGTTYYAHNFFSAGASSQDPINNIVTPKTVDWGWYLQDSWKILPTLTVNAGVRWDREDIKDYTGSTVITTTNEWQPRIGFVWDPQGNGSSKVYGFFGRFYYAIPTDLNVRAYGAQTQLTTYNTSPTDTHQDPSIFGHGKPFIQGGAFTEPVDAGLKGIYQDEFTVGFEKLLGPTLSVGVKGTYRTLGRAIEDRCDLDYTAPINQENTCAIVNPGSNGLWASGNVPGCNGLDGAAFNCFSTIPAIPEAKRIYRGIEFVGRKSFSQNLWVQASYVYSSLRGNYDGEVREGRGQTDPGINADFDYFLFLHNNYGKLFLDRPHNARLDMSYTTPFGLFIGLQTYVRSGAPLNKQGYFNSGYGAEIQLVPRGEAKRLPTEYDANLTLGFPIQAGPVTITPQLYVFNLIGRQIETLEDVRYSTSQPAGYQFCGDLSDPRCTIFDPNQQQTNPNYGKVTQRQDPRLIRGAIKISF